MGVTPRAIIITVPKIEGSVHQTEIRSRSESPNAPRNLDMNSIQDLENRLLLPSDLHSTMNDKRKRRLNHLSYEEKMHRKKLKNRVAAQTSRDRKKAKMDEMERSNQKLQEENAQLVAQCQMLQAENIRLTETNEALQKEIADRVSSTTTCHSCLTKATSCSDRTPHTPGPAESSIPLLKGWGVQMNKSLLVKHMTSLMRIWMLMTLTFPLFLTSWMNWTTWIASVTWRNWQKACLKMQGAMLMLKVQSHPNILRWWGKHQKMWNPMDQFQRIGMGVP